MKKLFLLGFILLPQLVCAEVKIEADVPFLGPDRPEKLDVYLPPESFQRPLPAILLIHGGGWRGGDKAEKRTASMAVALAENGYAVFSTNYLLNVGYRDDNNKLHITEVAWPQSLYDCKSALRFARAEASRFGIAPDRIGVMGMSAGGHLAMLVGATAEEDELNQHGLYLDQSNAVSCILDFYGIADLRGQRLTPFTGSDRKVTSAYDEPASPVTYFNADTPPFFIAHGTADKVIPVKASQDLVKSLEQHGIEYTYVEIEDAPHSFHLELDERDLRPEVFGFLQTHLGSPQTR